ncbi:MAG: hypothetical protein H6734_13065 [Alphaproteobacteria bacterium]|nr:hypothetical protein [Alphaproteobacteria bacterium]
MLWTVLVGCTSLTVDDTAGPAGAVLERDGLKVEVPAGAVPEGAELSLRRTDLVPDDVLVLSEAWAIEPADIVLSAPITVSFAAADPSGVVLAGDGYAFDVLDTTATDGWLSASTSTLGVFLAASIIQPVPPTPDPPITFVPALPDPAVVPGGPQPGGSWSCGTGDMDLGRFDDTAVPAQPDTTCDAGVGATIGDVGYGNLRAALAAVQPGDTVRICPGVHLGPYGAVPDGVTLEGVATDPASTILTGRLDGQILLATGDLTLRRLTLRRGYQENGGGALDGGSGTLTIDSVRFEQNLACSEGGGVRANGAVHIANSVFATNLSGYIAGAAELGMRWDPSSIVIENTRFEGNRSAVEAGALHVDGDGGTITVSGSQFVGNWAGYNGGALVNGSWDAHTLLIEGCLFEANHAGYEGGALDLASWSPADDVTVLDSTFSANTSPEGAAANISHWQGGTFVFDGITFDQSGTCALDVDIRPNGTPAIVELNDADLGTSAQPVCIGSNAIVTRDGAPYP